MSDGERGQVKGGENASQDVERERWQRMCNVDDSEGSKTITTYHTTIALTSAEMHDTVKTGQHEPEDEQSGGNARSPQTMANLLRDAHALTLRPRRQMQKLRKTQHASAMRNRLLGSAALQVHSLTHHSAKEDQPRWSTNRKRRHTSHSLPRSNASWPSRQSREVHPWTTLRSGAGVRSTPSPREGPSGPVSPSGRPCGRESWI